MMENLESRLRQRRELCLEVLRRGRPTAWLLLVNAATCYGVALASADHYAQRGGVLLLLGFILNLCAFAHSLLLWEQVRFSVARAAAELRRAERALALPPDGF